MNVAPLSQTNQTGQQLFHGLPVTDPQAFPNPTIRPCQRAQLNVRTSAFNNLTESKVVLIGGTGRMYELGEIIRDAIFGRVIHAMVLEPVPTNNSSTSQEYQRTNQDVAIKVYVRDRLRALQGRTQENPLMEITALQFFGDHPESSILGQIECCMDAENIFSVMRYVAGGELFDRITSTGRPLTNPQARHFFRQLLNALERFQSLGVAHRDMSLENILCATAATNSTGTTLNNDMDVDGSYTTGGIDPMNEMYVVIDFGMCLRLRPDPNQQQPVSGPGQQTVFLPIRKQAICGKRNYIAPEVLREDAYFYPMLCDIWASGIILFMVLTGIPPIDMASSNDDRFNMIAMGRLQEMVTSWGFTELDPRAVELIQRMLAVDPMRRPTIAEMRNHAWMLAED